MTEKLRRREWFARCAYLTAGGAAGLLLRDWLNAGPAIQAEQDAPGHEARLRRLGLELPPVRRPTNSLVSAVRAGDMLYVSGHGPSRPDGTPWVGKLGQGLDVQQGRGAARSVGLTVLSVVRAELGNLDRVVRLVRTFGMVNAAPDFRQHPEVINGFTDLMVEVFGEGPGKGSRCAVGMSSLPGGIAVEVEAVFQVRA